MIKLPDRIDVVEVGPRDGLQSLPKWIPTADKIRMVDRLSQAGLPVIEVTGFAHPKVIPNLSDAEAVFAGITRREGTIYRGLAPNAKGASRAIAAQADEIVGLTIASATYLKKNQNMTLDQASEQAIEAYHIASTHNVRYVLAIGMAFWCPYEGLIKEDHVLRLVARFHDAGIRRMYFAGSVGLEDPRHVESLFTKLVARYPEAAFGFHVHNLGGMATANILAAMTAGARWIEGAICGIGGGIAMPSALGAVGNYPTEDLLSMLTYMGTDTGVDAAEVILAAQDVAAILAIDPRSNAANGCTRSAIAAWGASHRAAVPG